MPHYKLYYFPWRAVGENVRQIFAYAGVEYEDIRVPMSEWTSGFKETTPFGQMPVLEVDGKQIPQSFAIARYLAKQFGLAGADAFEAAWVDAWADQYKDYQNEFNKYWWVFIGFRQGNLEQLKKEAGEPARDAFCTLLTKQLKGNPAGFIVGDKLTWVDLLISEHTATVAERPGFPPGWFDAFPEVTAHSARIRALPAIKKWIETRPDQ